MIKKNKPAKKEIGRSALDGVEREKKKTLGESLRVSAREKKFFGSACVAWWHSKMMKNNISLSLVIKNN